MPRLLWAFLNFKSLKNITFLLLYINPYSSPHIYASAVCVCVAGYMCMCVNLNNGLPMNDTNKQIISVQRKMTIMLKWNHNKPLFIIIKYITIIRKMKRPLNLQLHIANWIWWINKIKICNLISNNTCRQNNMYI